MASFAPTLHGGPQVLHTQSPLGRISPAGRPSSSAASAVTLSSPTPTPKTVDGRHNQSALSLNEQMQRQLQDYNRSITIILWYKAEAEPIRLQHMNPTFPYFQLLQLPFVINDLKLTTASYLDAYDPDSGKWEQHNIATVRVVAKQQRLLYKTRESLLEGLRDAECSGLKEEIQKQTKLIPSALVSPPGEAGPRPMLKRPASDAPPTATLPPAKIHIPNPDPAKSPVGPVAPQSSNSPRLSRLLPQFQPAVPPSPLLANAFPSAQAATGAAALFAYDPPQTTVFATAAPALAQVQSPPSETLLLPHPAPIPLPGLPSAPPSGAVTSSPPTLTLRLARPDTPGASVPHHPHPPLKRWPNDYTVAELTAGFHAMEHLMRPAQHSNGAAPLTQRVAFERVFGTRYVKSTVCRHRGVWRRTEGSPLRGQFEAMGSDEKACWGEFVRRVEGRVSGGNGGGGTKAEDQGPATDGAA